MIQTVNVTMAVPKESKEVVDAVVGLIRHFKQGGDLAGATAKLPMVLAAVDGWEKLGEELKGQQLDEAVGYVSQQVIDVLREPKPGEPVQL